MFSCDVVVGFDDDDDDDDDDGPCAKKGSRGINVVGCSEDGAGTGTTTDGLDDRRQTRRWASSSSNWIYHNR